MSVIFKNMTRHGETTSADYTVLCGDLHSAVYLGPVDLHVRKTFFYATQTTAEVIGGLGGRTIAVSAIISDATLTTRDLFTNYMAELDELAGARFDLEVKRTGEFTQTGYNCYFLGAQRKNTDGIGGMPLPNYVSAPVGPPGNYWLEVVLMIRQPNLDDITVTI